MGPSSSKTVQADVHRVGIRIKTGHTDVHRPELAAASGPEPAGECMRAVSGVDRSRCPPRAHGDVDLAGPRRRPRLRGELCEREAVPREAARRSAARRAPAQVGPASRVEVEQSGLVGASREGVPKSRRRTSGDRARRPEGGRAEARRLRRGAEPALPRRTRALRRHGAAVPGVPPRSQGQGRIGRAPRAAEGAGPAVRVVLSDVRRAGRRASSSWTRAESRSMAAHSLFCAF